jgi:hypothetical protein
VMVSGAAVARRISASIPRAARPNFKSLLIFFSGVAGYC